ncbi:hypothetical protein J6590_055442 [Homalodisca vitripennis]|nr:hypothetical protein J6590_055442 [Homalodisca vitripennis]
MDKSILGVKAGTRRESQEAGILSVKSGHTMYFLGRVLCCEEFFHLFSIQYLDARQDNLEEPRSQRLLFDELFWFGGSSSSPDDDEKPGLASCSCRKVYIHNYWPV